MTETKWEEVAKVYEEELLHCLRNAERMKSKLMKLYDDDALLNIEYNAEKDRLEWEFNLNSTLIGGRNDIR